MSRESWGKVSEVFIGVDETFANTVFVTIDMDWAHDEVMRDTHAMLSDAGVPSTWFVTHRSPFLYELRDDPSVELGIHPNFNFLLASDSRNGSSVREVIERLLEIVPEAKSVRAHSLLQSSRILEEYAALGLTHDATHYVEPSASTSLGPWMHYGLVRVPLVWEDYVELHRSPGAPSLALRSDATSQPLCWQLDFHPIHVFMNSPDLERYEKSRSIHLYPEVLRQQRFTGHGIRSLLQDLLDLGDDL